MKQTHCNLIVEFFRRNNGSATLAELLREGYGSWGHSLTRRLSDLRAKGYIVTCLKGIKPSQNVYSLTEPSTILVKDAPHDYETKQDFGELFKGMDI